MPDAEVSPFFHDIAAIGDEIEVRGPLGGHFLWPEPAIDPVLLIGEAPPRAVDGNDPAAPRIGPSRSDSVAPVRTNRRGRSLLRRTSLHRNQRSGVRPGARDYARETGSRIGLCATDRRHDGPRNSNQASGKADASVRLRV